MPALASFLANIFASLFTWLGTYLTKRAANAVALTVLIAGAAVAMFAIVNGLIAALVFAAPDELGIALSWVWPTNGSACLSAIFGTEIALAGYRWHKDTVRAMSYVT
ncbi:MAG: DUF5455 family protein [Pseudomonadota bacterium]